MSTPTVTALTCDMCGAPLQARPGQLRATCGHCGTAHLIESPKPAPQKLARRRWLRRRSAPNGPAENGAHVAGLVVPLGLAAVFALPTMVTIALVAITLVVAVIVVAWHRGAGSSRRRRPRVRSRS